VRAGAVWWLIFKAAHNKSCHSLPTAAGTPLRGAHAHPRYVSSGTYRTIKLYGKRWVVGLRATLYMVDVNAYSAVREGNISDFDVIDKNGGLHLDKAWHAISFLITGSSDMKFISNGMQLPEVSETAEVISPLEVKKICDMIDEKSIVDYRNTYNANIFDQNQIYNGPWKEGGFSYIEPFLGAAIDYLKYSASMGYGLFVVIA
jgi:hypothetical protein